MNRDYNAAAAMNIRQNLIYWMDNQGTFNPIFQRKLERTAYGPTPLLRERIDIIELASNEAWPCRVAIAAYLLVYAIMITFQQLR